MQKKHQVEWYNCYQAMSFARVFVVTLVFLHWKCYEVSVEAGKDSSDQEKTWHFGVVFVHLFCFAPSLWFTCLLSFQPEIWMYKNLWGPHKRWLRECEGALPRKHLRVLIQLTCFFPQILTFLVTELLKFPDVTKLEAKARELEQTLLGTSSSSAHFSPFFPKETN